MMRRNVFQATGVAGNRGSAHRGAPRHGYKKYFKNKYLNYINRQTICL
jgi:hypothetical protein